MGNFSSHTESIINSLKSDNVTKLNHILTSLNLNYFDKLFVQFDTICQLLIEQNTDWNHWIFGLPFVDEYGMEFDYEKQSITFYDAHPFELFNDKIRSSKSSTKTIILINIILLVISSINLSIKC